MSNQTIKARYDVVVVGGGITGQLVARSLAKLGKHVALLEGTPAAQTSPSARNHGIVHSGAMFVEKHPEIVPDCQEAQAHFWKEFSHYTTTFQPSLYLLPKERAEQFHQTALHYHLPVIHLAAGTNVPFLQSWVKDRFSFFHVPELILDRQRVLTELWKKSQEAGVTILSNTPVQTIQKTALGYQLQLPLHTLQADQVVLAAGAGMAQLLTQLNSRHATQLATRTATMLIVPAPALPQPILTLHPQGPVIVPHPQGALTSLYGGTQPTTTDTQADIHPPLISEVITSIKQYLAPGLVNWNSYTAYHSTKTDYLGNFTENGVSPHYAVINHANDNELEGLWTVIPGKWTLAYAATKKLLEYLA